MNLKTISLKLNKLAEDYEKARYEYDKAEDEVNYKTAQFMLAAQGLASQPLRNAQVDMELHDMEGHDKYIELRSKVEVTRQLLYIYTQISKNMISASWGEVDYGD